MGFSKGENRDSPLWSPSARIHFAQAITSGIPLAKYLSSHLEVRAVYTHCTWKCNLLNFWIATATSWPRNDVPCFAVIARSVATKQSKIKISHLEVRAVYYTLSRSIRNSQSMLLKNQLAVLSLAMIMAFRILGLFMIL